MNDKDPSGDERFLDRELDSAALRVLLHDVGEELIVRGAINEEPGVFSTQAIEVPRRFTYPLEARFVKDMFFPNDDDRIATKDSYIGYSTPMQLEQNNPKTRWAGSVYVIISSELPGGVRITESYTISGADEDSLNGEHDIEVAQDGIRIQPTYRGFEHGSDSATDDQIMNFLDDIAASQRSLTHNDASKMRKVLVHVQTLPLLTE